MQITNIMPAAQLRHALPLLLLSDRCTKPKDKATCDDIFSIGTRRGSPGNRGPDGLAGYRTYLRADGGTSIGHDWVNWFKGMCPAP